MQVLLHICRDWGEEKGMEFCGEKSGVMAFGTERRKEFNLTIGNVTVQRVKEYEYLGVCLSEEDDFIAKMKEKLVK